MFDDNLPAGCEIIEKVPTSREMFYNNPKKRPAVCIEPAQSEILAVGKESALEIEQSSKKTAAQQKEVTTTLKTNLYAYPKVKQVLWCTGLHWKSFNNTQTSSVHPQVVNVYIMVVSNALL